MIYLKRVINNMGNNPRDKLFELQIREIESYLEIAIKRIDIIKEDLFKSTHIKSWNESIEVKNLLLACQKNLGIK